MLVREGETTRDIFERVLRLEKEDTCYRETRDFLGAFSFLFACKETFQVWTLLIIFTILLWDIFTCFMYESQAIGLAFTDLWDDYGFVVIVISWFSSWLY